MFKKHIDRRHSYLIGFIVPKDYRLRGTRNRWWKTDTTLYDAIQKARVGIQKTH